MRRLLHLLGNDRFSSALILLLVVVVTTGSGVLGRVDNLLYDLGLRQQVRPPPDDIVIVAIDEDSLSKLGRWPWSRRLHATLVDRLHADGARVIGLDLVFSEPDTADQPADALLAEAVGRAGNVVLPVLLENNRVNGQVLETLPLPLLVEQAAGLGRVHVELDLDGIGRSLFLWEGVGAPVWPHFAQAVLDAAGLLPPSLSRTPPTSAEESPFALVRQGQRRFAFLGPPGHVRSVSYAQVLTGDFAPGSFRDRIVLVGATAAGMGDLLPTPVSGQGQPMPGVEIHANALDAMRTGHLVREAPLAWTLVIGVLLALAPLAWLPRTNPLGGLLATTAWFFAVMAAAVMLPLVARTWVPPAGALLAILVAYPVWSWRRLESAGRFLDQELKRLRRQLGSEAGAPPHSLPRDPFAARIRQVQAASYRLRHLQEERRETLAFLSHDIRAPIAAALMRLDDVPAAARLHEPLARALALAEKFLRVARAEALDAARFEELDVAALAHQAVDDAWTAARARAVRLVRRLPDEPVWMQGDFGLLHRALLNLVLNAVQHAPEETEVDVALETAGDWATLTVVDHGPGISPDVQARLFQRFSRGSETLGGTGLGLYFVRTVAEKHGGSASASSEPGAPTRFKLRLPLSSSPDANTAQWADHE